MWKRAYVGVYQLLNWKMQGETLTILLTGTHKTQLNFNTTWFVLGHIGYCSWTNNFRINIIETTAKVIVMLLSRIQYLKPIQRERENKGKYRNWNGILWMWSNVQLRVPTGFPSHWALVQCSHSFQQCVQLQGTGVIWRYWVSHCSLWTRAVQNYIPHTLSTATTVLFTIHSFSILSDDRSKASSKTMPPYSAMQSLLLQMRISSPVLKVIQ